MPIVLSIERMIDTLDERDPLHRAHSPQCARTCSRQATTTPQYDRWLRLERQGRDAAGLGRVLPALVRRLPRRGECRQNTVANQGTRNAADIARGGIVQSGYGTVINANTVFFALRALRRR